MESDDHDPEVEAIYTIERDIMIGCFALRRLLGMPYKVTPEIRKKTASVMIYPIREGQQPPDAIDALDAYGFYNLDQPSPLNRCAICSSTAMYCISPGISSA